jgi:hypothetical protein
MRHGLRPAAGRGVNRIGLPKTGKEDLEKRLSASREKAIEIKHAHVAELVDARYLKFPAATENVQLSCKTFPA